MPSTPVFAFPYPAATDAADVPADIAALGNRVEAVMLTPNGRELIDVPQTVDQGPTGVATANPGDSLVDFGVQTVRNVPHWVEMTLLIKASAAATLFLLLYDGTPSSPGALLAYAPIYVPVSPSLVVSLRLRFTPTAGTRGYHVRWRNDSAAGTLFTIQNSLYVAHYTLREVLR